MPSAMADPAISDFMKMSRPFIYLRKTLTGGEMIPTGPIPLLLIIHLIPLIEVIAASQNLKSITSKRIKEIFNIIMNIFPSV